MAIVLNRQKAVEYAQKYWDEESGNYNKLFPHFDGNDCTNFVSQCWNYAGISRNPNWNVSFVPGATTKSWTIVDDFAEYMTNTSSADTEDGLSIAVMKWDSNEVTIGDIIQFYSESEEHDGWYHSVIISKIDPVYGICYAAHTKHHLQRPLSDVYPNGGVTEVRFICPRYDE